MVDLIREYTESVEAASDRAIDDADAMLRTLAEIRELPEIEEGKA